MIKYVLLLMLIGYYLATGDYHALRLMLIAGCVAAVLYGDCRD